MHLAICVRIQTQDNSPGDHTVNCHRCYLLGTKINPEVVGGELAMRVGGVVQRWGQRGVGLGGHVLRTLLLKV